MYTIGKRDEVSSGIEFAIQMQIMKWRHLSQQSSHTNDKSEKTPRVWTITPACVPMIMAEMACLEVFLFFCPMRQPKTPITTTNNVKAMMPGIASWASHGAHSPGPSKKWFGLQKPQLAPSRLLAQTKPEPGLSDCTSILRNQKSDCLNWFETHHFQRPCLECLRRTANRSYTWKLIEAVQATTNTRV